MAAADRLAGDVGHDRAALPLRARSAEAKEMVRDSLIAAGRRLFATEAFADVSLRQIAKEAGYSAGVVYKYFPDRDSLFRAIRDVELAPYVEELEQAFRSHDDPEERILAMSRLAAAFAQRSARDFGIRFIYATNTLEKSDNPAPGQAHGIDPSPVSYRVQLLHREAVDAFLSQLPRRPIDSLSAANSVIAAVAGMAVLPGTAKEGPLQNRAELTEGIIRALLCYWRLEGSRPPSA